MEIKNWQAGTGMTIGSVFDTYVIHTGKKTTEVQFILWKDSPWFEYSFDRWDGTSATCGFFGWNLSITILKFNLYIARYS
jgi:hypothetical protein